MLQLLFSLSLPLSVLSAGITVHTELGKRAMDLYDEHTYFETGVVRRILEDNQDAFQAGIPFPDFFYNPLCGDFGDVAEDAHWGPYLKVAVDYFRRTYPAPFEGNEERKMTLSDVYYGSYDAEKLFAFLYGVAVHQTTDTSWHGLEGLAEGVIRMLAEVEFDGSYNDAHSMMDTGGDIAGAFLFGDMSYAEEWYLPSDDLYNILLDYYDGDDQGLKAESFERCGFFLHALRTLEHLEAESILYSPVADRSPTMIDELEEYVSGGMDDMTSWTRLVWDTLTFMFSEGTDGCDITDNPMTIECQQQRRKARAKLGNAKAEPKRIDPKKHSRIHFPNPSLPEGAEQMLEVRRTEKGAYIKLVSPEKKPLSSSFSSPRSAGDSNLFSSRPYSELGHSVASLGNGGGMAVGAPGYIQDDLEHYKQGCVFVIADAKSISGDDAVEDEAEQILCEPEPEDYPYSRFGHSLAASDVDGDGIMDLVIGAPGSGTDSLTYFGRLLVFRGLSSSSSSFSSTPDWTFEGDGEYASLGWETVALKGELGVISSSRYFLGGGLEQAGEIGLLSPSPSSPSFSNVGEGSSSFDWLGHSLASFESESQGTLLVVGAPGSHECGREGCFNSPGKAVIMDAERGSVLAELHGREDLEKFGQAVEVGRAEVGGEVREVIVVGAPFSTTSSARDEHAGAVYVFDLIEALEDEDDAEPISVIEGELKHGRFGSRLKLLSNSYLVVGSPRHNDRGDEETGSVFVFSDLGDSSESSDAEFEFQGGEFSFLGGGQIQQIGGEEGGDVWVAAGATSDSDFGIRRGGSVAIWRL